MRIIDLLNKIANGEEVPEIISYMGQRFKLRDNAFYNEIDGGFELRDYYSSKDLNDEVEVIEDNKKIETITTFYDNDLEEYIAETKINGNRIKECYGSPFEQMIIEKIKEIIEVLNDKD